MEVANVKKGAVPMGSVYQTHIPDPMRYDSGRATGIRHQQESS